jgi:hypothetical protein
LTCSSSRVEAGAGNRFPSRPSGCVAPDSNETTGHRRSPSGQRWLGRDGRCHSAPVAEQAPSPYGAIDRGAVAVHEPGVSWKNKSAKPALPRSGATLPEAADGLSRVQHGHGTTCRASIDHTPVRVAHQGKLRNLQVPVSSSTVSQPSINSSLGRAVSWCSRHAFEQSQTQPHVGDASRAQAATGARTVDDGTADQLPDLEHCHGHATSRLSSGDCWPPSTRVGGGTRACLR